MGKRIALTEEQRNERETEETCQKILEAVNARRRYDEEKGEFAKRLGLEIHTWNRWNKTKLSTAGFRDVLDMVRASGAKLTITVDPRIGGML